MTNDITLTYDKTFQSSDTEQDLEIICDSSSITVGTQTGTVHMTYKDFYILRESVEKYQSCLRIVE